MIRYCGDCQNIYFVLQTKSTDSFRDFCPACTSTLTISWPLWRAEAALEEYKKSQGRVTINNLEKIIMMEEQLQVIERMES